MKLPIFHKYFSTNIAISTIILELLSFILAFVLFLALQNPSSFSLLLLNLYILLYTYIFLVPLFILLILVEFFLRKKGRIIKTNIVNIPIKLQKYIYLISILAYLTLTIVGIIISQPMSEEELLFD